MKKILTSVSLAVLITAACTNLDETLYSTLESSDYGKTAAEIETIVGGAYAKLRGFRDNTSI